LKILLLSTCYPTRSRPDFGIFIHRQARALRQLGVECHVLQPVNASPPAPWHHLHPGWEEGHRQRWDVLSSWEGIPIHPPVIRHPKPSRFFPGDFWERVGRGVARYVGKRPELRSADLLYAHFLCHEGYAGWIVKQHLGLPLAAIARGDDIHAWPERWPDRAAKLATVLAGADALFACSWGLARHTESWAVNGLSRPIEVIYNGIETKRFSPGPQEEARQRLGLSAGEKILLSVATPIAAKGWPELLDAFAAVAPEGWHLVGSGAPRGAGDLDLAAEAATRGIGNRFTWLGLVNPQGMPDLYRAADAFALASHNEGLSNSLLEAMACGLPVLATAVGGHAEVIEDRVSGRLVPPRSPWELASALRSLLSAEAVSWGAEGRQRALAIGSPRQNAKKLLAHFETLCAAS
jgi:teichuronic acid biosynthesis glycosyltransferase TuaC